MERALFFYRPRAWVVCVFLLLGWWAPAHAWDFDTSRDSVGLLVGYGQSVPGWGDTSQRVETVDLTYRYKHHVFDILAGTALQGDYSVVLELPVHLVVEPETSAMLGVNFLAFYTVTSDAIWQPYLFGGGGPVYSFADIPGMGAEWNGNYQFGFGLQHVLGRTRAFLVEARYHHISNAGTAEPNEPLNSFKILMGITF